jgi:hypothetical protein
MASSGVAPLRIEGSAVPARRAATVALGVALVALVLGGWAVALATGLVVAVALGWRWGQVLLRAVGVGLFAAAAGFVIAKQWRFGFVVDFNWMNQFELTHAWTLTAVALLVADPLVSHLRDARPDAASGRLSSR